MARFGQRRVSVTDWSALSGLGVGRDAFRQGFLAAGDGPDGRLVEDFDAAETLGRKGTRTLDRMTAQVIATAGMVLAGRDDSEAARARIGLVLGSSTGSVQSITDFTRDTFVRERPYLVNPADFPSTVMNNAAGRTAIWYGLRGPNSTIAAGHLTGLVALRYASRLIRLGYVDTLLVGAVEEVPTMPKAFRRLMHKTQVFIAPDGDHFRTRLTHSLEMMQISRTIARSLQLNEDLTEAIALGHDLGHTPFGHTGEEALSRVLAAHGRTFRRQLTLAPSRGPPGERRRWAEPDIRGEGRYT